MLNGVHLLLIFGYSIYKKGSDTEHASGNRRLQVAHTMMCGGFARKYRDFERGVPRASVFTVLCESRAFRDQSLGNHCTSQHPSRAPNLQLLDNPSRSAPISGHEPLGISVYVTCAALKGVTRYWYLNLRNE